ncbi:MAG: hypothetical protein VX589_11590 [Myxococcota bacterium]|nr:hypothetical protein [Myxococcota bacterium]
MNAILTVIFWASPLITATDVSADKLVVSADTTWLTGNVQLRLGDLTVRSVSARLTKPTSCPSVDSPSDHGSAAPLCQQVRRLRFDHASVTGPTGRLTGRKLDARLTEKPMTLELSIVDGRLTRCRCSSPPWTIGFKRATVRAGKGGWMHWPVLRFHGVPVATAPIWYVPLGRHRSGLLPPKLSWMSTGGTQMVQPIYWAINPHMDAELGAGVRGLSAPVGHARYRWHLAPSVQGHISALNVDADVRVTADGFLGQSGDGLQLDGEFMNAPGRRQAFVVPWEAGRQRHTHGLAQLKWSGHGLAMGLDGLIVQDIRWLSAIEPDTVQSPLFGWAQGQRQFGANTLSFTISHRHIWSPQHGHIYRLQTSPAWAGEMWLSILKVSGQAQGHISGLTSENGLNLNDDYRIEGSTALIAEIAAAGQIMGSQHHTALSLEGRFTELRGGETSTAAPIWMPAFPERMLRLAWKNVLNRGDASLQVITSQTIDKALPTRQRLPVQVDWRWHTPWLMVLGQHQEKRLHTGAVRIGEHGHPQVHLGTVYFNSPHIEHPLYRRMTMEGGYWSPPQQLDLWTVTSGLHMHHDTFIFGATGAVNPADGRLVGLGGRLDITSRCNCWVIGLNAEREQATRTSRLFVNVRLSPLDPRPLKAQ